MFNATFSCPDFDTFTRLDTLGLTVTGQHVDDERAVLACRVIEPDDWCRRCGCQGVARDTVTRRFAHLPLGLRSTTLLVTIRRYRCTGCGHVWRQNTELAAAPRSKLSRLAVLFALKSLVIDRLSVARIAALLAASWHAVNNAVLATGRELLIDDPARFDGVAVIGVDEHCWRHTRRGGRFVTVIIDLTPVRDKTGPARLLDLSMRRDRDSTVVAEPRRHSVVTDIMCIIGTTWKEGRDGQHRPASPLTSVDADYPATAYVPPAELADGVASLILRVADRTSWRSPADGGWLIVENEPP